MTIDLEKHIQYVEEFYTGMEEEGLDREQNWLRFKAVTDAARAYLSIASVTDEDRKKCLNDFERVWESSEKPGMPDSAFYWFVTHTNTIRACLLNGNTGWNFNMDEAKLHGEDVFVLHKNGHRRIAYWSTNEDWRSQDGDLIIFPPIAWTCLPASPVKDKGE